jgi:ribonuclease HI
MILIGAENLDNVHDVLCAEAHASLIAIIVAADQGTMQIQLESDSMVLVKALKSPD